MDRMNLPGMHRFTLLLASNKDATVNMATAKKRLDAYFNHSLRWSDLHESQAYGDNNPTTPRYLNAVCQGQTSLTLTDVTAWLKALETEMGRQRGASANGQVTIDLDVVVWDDSVLRPNDAGRSYYQVCLADLASVD